MMAGGRAATHRAVIGLDQEANMGPVELVVVIVVIVAIAAVIMSLMRRRV